MEEIIKKIREIHTIENPDDNDVALLTVKKDVVIVVTWKDLLKVLNEFENMRLKIIDEFESGDTY